MKNMMLTIAIVSIVGSVSLLAADKDEQRKQFREEFRKQFREQNDILLRVGVDALGGNDDTEKIATGKKGNDRSMGYELSMGAEEKVDDFEFGSRRMMTIYNHGDATYYNGTYMADIKNFGVEMTGAKYFKATQYVKPYIGAGLGLNINQYNDHGQSIDSESFQPTIHVVGGVSGELFVGIGYFAEYKYRYGANVTKVVPLASGSTTKIENNGVVGGQVMAGVSYQF